MKNNTRALRRYKTTCYQQRQLKIVKDAVRRGYFELVLPAGYFHTRAAMDCGCTQCYGCGRIRFGNSTEYLTFPERLHDIEMQEGLDEYYVDRINSGNKFIGIT